MLNEHEPPKEPAKIRAARKWKSAELRRRVKQAQLTPKKADQKSEPEIAETITNDGRRDGPLRRSETRFKKDIREMIEGHTAQNLSNYMAALEYRRYRLLKEKLRRLKLAQQEQGG
jgi:hypothetical protein